MIASRDFVSKCLWALPGKFALTRALGPDYELRVVLFHEVSSKTNEFTEGLHLTVAPEVFEERIAFLAQHYSPVTMEQVIASRKGATPLPVRPVLVTFDDAYGSIARVAAPILKRHGVPAVFFVNVDFIDGATLGLDNILCFAANTQSIELVDQAAAVIENSLPPFKDCTDAIRGFTSRLDIGDIQTFRSELLQRLERNPVEEARALGLHMTRDELCALEEFDIELGNHTAGHVWCRNLDEAGRASQLLAGRMKLEAMTGRSVTSFSVPYGRKADLTPEVEGYLTSHGHEALFLVEGLPNRSGGLTDRYNRVSLKGTTDDSTFAELELLPRLRWIRDFVRAAR